MHADHWARSTNHDLTDFFSVIKIRLIKSTSIDIYASICNEVHVEFNGKSLLKCQCNLTRNKYGKIIHPSNKCPIHVLLRANLRYFENKVSYLEGAVKNFKLFF